MSSCRPSRSARRMLARQQAGICVLCGGPLVEPTIDHLVPRSRGGSNKQSNLALACCGCNNLRGDAPLTDEQLARAARFKNLSPRVGPPKRARAADLNPCGVCVGTYCPHIFGHWI